MKYNDIGIDSSLDWNRIRKLFEHYHIRKFCNNDLCMCVLYRSAKFIRYSDRVDGDYCHEKLINLSH